jgi:hypothetical protein
MPAQETPALSDSAHAGIEQHVAVGEHEPCEDSDADHLDGES